MEVSKEVAAVREVLRGVEERALAEIAVVLSEAAESVARAVEATREAQPGAWMDSKQAYRVSRWQDGRLLRESLRQDGHPQTSADGAGDPLQLDRARRLADVVLTPIRSLRRKFVVLVRHF